MISVLRPVILLLVLFATCQVRGFKYPEEIVEEQRVTWPSAMTFSETKTNYMLGEALLKRIYARVESTENLIRLEMSQLFDKLKGQMQKNFRKCDRKRRVATGGRAQNGNTSMYMQGRERGHQSGIQSNQRGIQSGGSRVNERFDPVVHQKY